MITFEEARKLADSTRTFGPADRCIEFADAWAFTGKNDPETEGGMGGCVVVSKKDGKLYGLTSYYRLHNWDAGEEKVFDI